MNGIKTRLVNFVVKNVFKGVTKVDFLHVVKGSVYQNGIKISDEARESYIRHATTILDNVLNKQIDDEMRFIAQQMLFTNSKNNDDMVFSKALLWYIAERNKKLKELSKLNIK